jgi:hypothetical protein
MDKIQSTPNWGQIGAAHTAASVIFVTVVARIVWNSGQVYALHNKTRALHERIERNRIWRDGLS